MPMVWAYAQIGQACAISFLTQVSYMNICQLIKKEYLTVLLHEDMPPLANGLTSDFYVVVSNEEMKAVGLLTHYDILNHPKGKVKDSNFLKPPVSPDCEVAEVFNLMEKTGTDTLPVFNQNDFVGVITRNDLTQHLIDQLDRYKLIFQQVTHDLRNPITNIMGLNRLLQENLEKEENLELTEMIREASVHALDILNVLLFMEKKENDQSEIEITELNDFIMDSLINLKGILSTKNIELVCNLSQEKFWYLIDRLHLNRTIHNLASNAIKFSYPNTKIHVSSIILGNTFTFIIQDHGIGIPEHKQAFIFDQFTPASRPGTNGEKSTGLGLYFAKAFIERLKGRIWFDSKEGLGSTFFIEFKI